MKFHEVTLSNRLRLLVIPLPHVHSFTTMVMAGAGSRYEKKRLTGLAHMAEHMAFKGTYKRPSTQEVACELDRIGAVYNAGTGYEHTLYYIKAAHRHLALSFDLISDMLFNSKFEEVEIDREKGVITEEINMDYDTPAEYAGFVFQRLLYGDTPLGRDIAGTKESVRSFTQQDLKGFFKRWYKPGNMVVVVAGRVTFPKVRELAEKHFGDLASQPWEELAPLAEKQDKPALRLHHKRSDQAHLILGVRTFPHQHPDRYVLEVLSTILGGGMSSRLFINVRERLGLAFYVFTFLHEYHDVGNLGVQAGVDIKRIDLAIGTILKELEKVKAEVVSMEELRRAKQNIRGHLLLSLEDTGNVAGFFGMRKLLQDKLETVEEVLQKIDQVRKEDVQRVAQKIFRNEKLNLALIGPYRDTERFRRLLTVD